MFTYPISTCPSKISICVSICMNLCRDPNKYIAVEVLNERGYSKLVQQCDAKVAAAAAGLAIRPLLIAEIQGKPSDL